MLQVTSSSFPLTQDLSFGTSYGLKLQYLKSQAANPASAGVVRLGNAESIKWRNQANSADLDLTVNSSNALQFNGSSILGAGLGSIVDADINAAAAIALSKLAAVTASRALVSDGSGFVSASAVTSTELGHLSGVSSAIQTQIDTKAPSASPTFSGTVTTPLTASRAVVTGSSSELAASAVTSTELSHLSGVSSAIQTQIDTKAPLVSPSLTTPNIGAATGTSLAMGESLDASSILDVASTSKGFLEPRMTQAQRDAISSPATGLQIYNTTTNKLNFYNGTAWGEIGSGSSGINYILATDGSFIGDWAAFADPAATTPDNGTGGSPNSTFAVSTNSSMRGTTNFLFTKNSGASRQGEGFSYPFSIDASDKGKVLQISFEYLIASGTFADNDLDVWIYDVTNAALIQPAPYHLKNSSLVEKFACEFQTSSSSTSYRLIFFNPTTTDSSYTVRFDKFEVSPQAKLYGSPITDWVSFTPTGSWVTNATYTGKRRQVGDSEEFDIKIDLTGAPTATALTVTLPITIDTTKLASTASGKVLGLASTYDSSPDEKYNGFVSYNSTTVVNARHDDGDGTNSAISSTNPITFASGDIVHLRFSVPVLGRSSSVVMSSDADTRVVAYKGYVTTHSNTYNMNNSYVKVTFDTTIFDKQGAFDNVTNKRYNVPTPGVYRVGVKLRSATTNVLAAIYEAVVYKNGVADTVIATHQPAVSTPITLVGSGLIEVVAGDYLEIYLYGAGNNSASAITLNSTNLYIERISGPAQIAASDTMSARYTTAAGQSIDNAVDEIVDFGTKDFDYTGAVTTGASWKFTPNSSGLFEVTAAVGFTANATGIRQIALFKNGSAVSILGYKEGHASITGFVQGSDKIRLLASDYIDIRAYQNSGGGLALVSSSGSLYNFISITRVGNF